MKHFHFAIFTLAMLGLASCNLFDLSPELERNCTLESYNGTAYEGHRLNGTSEGYCDVKGNELKYSNGKDVEVTDFIVNKRAGAQTFIYTDAGADNERKTDNAVVKVSPDGKKWEVVHSSQSVLKINANSTHHLKKVFTIYK